MTYTDGAGLVTETGVAEHGPVTDVKVRHHITGGHHLFDHRAVVIIVCNFNFPIY